jgi:hypothetical protein
VQARAFYTKAGRGGNGENLFHFMGLEEQQTALNQISESLRLPHRTIQTPDVRHVAAS